MLTMELISKLSEAEMELVLKIAEIEELSEFVDEYCESLSIGVDDLQAIYESDKRSTLPTEVIRFINELKSIDNMIEELDNILDIYSTEVTIGIIII